MQRPSTIGRCLVDSRARILGCSKCKVSLGKARLQECCVVNRDTMCPTNRRNCHLTSTIVGRCTRNSIVLPSGGAQQRSHEPKPVVDRGLNLSNIPELRGTISTSSLFYPCCKRLLDNSSIHGYLRILEVCRKQGAT